MFATRTAIVRTMLVVTGLALCQASFIWAGPYPRSKVALLVGVEQYRDNAFGPLAFCEEDVAAVEIALERLGFDVTCLTGSGSGDGTATREEIERTARRLAARLGRNDLMLVMLSGHGEQIQVDDEEDSFYCPVDARTGEPETLLSLSHLTDEVLTPRVGRVLLLVDACRNAVRRKGIDGRRIDLPEGCGIYFSCRSKESSFEVDELKHGVFTHFLLKGLRGGAADTDEEISWSGVINYVGKQMSRSRWAYKQTPIAAGQVEHSVLGRVGPTFDRQETVQRLVDQLTPHLGDGDVVSVGRFGGEGFTDVGLMKDLAEAFRRELTDRQFQAGAGGLPRITGRLLRVPTNPERKLRGYRIRATLENSDDEQHVAVVSVGDVEEAAATAFGTGELMPPPTSGSPPRTRPLQRPTIRGSRVFPAPDSPYSVELCRISPDGGQEELIPLEVERNQGNGSTAGFHPDGGQISFHVAKGEAYFLRLHNDSEFDAACRVRIDGLSRFVLADDPADRIGGDLVSAGSSRDIVGWFRDDDTVNEFVVGEYSKSVAAREYANITEAGTISVTFAACWVNDRDRPSGDLALHSKPLGTASGRLREDKVVTAKRYVGDVRAAVRLRYIQE